MEENNGTEGQGTPQQEEPRRAANKALIVLCLVGVAIIVDGVWRILSGGSGPLLGVLSGFSFAGFIIGGLAYLVSRKRSILPWLFACMFLWVTADFSRGAATAWRKQSEATMQRQAWQEATAKDPTAAGIIKGIEGIAKNTSNPQEKALLSLSTEHMQKSFQLAKSHMTRLEALGSARLLTPSHLKGDPSLEESRKMLADLTAASAQGWKEMMALHDDILAKYDKLSLTGPLKSTADEVLRARVVRTRATHERVAKLDEEFLSAYQGALGVLERSQGWHVDEEGMIIFESDDDVAAYNDWMSKSDIAAEAQNKIRQDVMVTTRETLGRNGIYLPPDQSPEEFLNMTQPK